MNRIETLVITKYDEYRRLIKNEKLTRRDVFALSIGSGSKKAWNLADLELKYAEGDQANLVTEQSVKKSTKYRIILFARTFATEPLCRFDSDGIAHENIISKVPLVKRKVETPHFHQYDNRGINYAFKTEFLINNEQVIRDNIQIGLQEMCTEYSIFTTEKSIPNIMKVGGLFPPKKPGGLHDDIDFPV